MNYEVPALRAFQLDSCYEMDLSNARDLFSKLLFFKGDKNHHRIIYQIDTIYIEVNQPMDIFPWELGCADTANTQYAMNQCAAKCFQVADSLTDQIYQLIRTDLIDQNTNRDRMENRFEQMERLDQLQANFTAIKTGSG